MGWSFVEQKQLDEMEESVFSEEFIDEDDLFGEGSNTAKSTKNNHKKEKEATKKAKLSKKSAAKKNVKTSEENSSERDDKSDKKVDLQSKFNDVQDQEEISISPAKENLKDKKKVISSVDSSAGSSRASSSADTSVNKFSSVDPWEDDPENEKDVFSSASLWKVATAVAIILLLFSVFTQGFTTFDKSELKDELSGAATASTTLSLAEVEQKALNFVNNNLLQPPFNAELSSSEDVGSLYKVVLSIAGQTVDSYITKDGKLFFPQGFDVDNVLEAESNEAEGDEAESKAIESNEEDTDEEDTGGVKSEAASNENKLQDTADENAAAADDTAATTDNLVATDNTTSTLEDQPESPEGDLESAEINESVESDTLAETETATTTVPAPVVTEPAATTPTGAAKKLTLSSKKWSFSPNKLTVKKGDLIKLTIIPDNSNPAFNLAKFTFGIAELGVSKEVESQTLIEFTADKVGTFEFKCSSCEDWRGMSGQLIVE